MAKIAILGFGNIGSGVLEVLRRNAGNVTRRAGQPVEVKYILDVRDFSASPDAALFVNTIDPVLSDPEVTLVVETIGGVRFAYPYVKAALESGRSVCTSNKELVATHGAELIAIAKQKGCAFLFEASVGGGTPLITPMHQSLAADVICGVQGIVNGTTNFMLTKMEKEGFTFDEALKLAQQLGYAETKDPGDDVDGRDAGRKIAILASIAGGVHVYPQDVPTRGIRGITPADLENAKALGCAVKLIAWAKRSADGEGFTAGVEPMLVPQENQLAAVSDVYNGILVKGEMLGDVLFYGKGAGKLPTASAVVADVIEALKKGSRVHETLYWMPAAAKEKPMTDLAPAAYYMRVEGLSADDSAAAAQAGGAEAAPAASDAILAKGVTPAGLAAATAAVQAAGGTVALTLKCME